MNITIFRFVIFCSVACMADCAAGQELSHEQILEGEKRFLKSRENMVEVHVKLSGELVNHTIQAFSRKFTKEIWATDGNLRLDSRTRFAISNLKNEGMSLQADENGEWVRDVIIQHCEQRGQMFCGTDLAQTPKYLGPHQWNRSQIANLFHPNLIGCSCGSSLMYRHHPLNLNICSADRRDLKITQPKLGDRQTCKLVWISARNVQISLWLDPALGYYPVQIEARSESILPEVEAVYARMKIMDIAPARGNGTLFPRKLHYEQFVANKVTDEEKVTIDEVEIGPKIDPALFTIAGTKLGSTFFIMKPDLQKSGQWTEDKFIPYPEFSNYRTEAFVETPPVPVDLPKSRTWQYALAAALIGLAALWFVARQVASARVKP
jgi:hypothetical protein